MEQPIEKKYTYADLLEMDDGERYEIIFGDLYMMSSPMTAHQAVFRELFLKIGNYLEGKPCKIFSAPFDVRLFERKIDSPNNVDTVVQPDIMVVCDKKKIDNKGCKGAPDWIIEILSPSSRRYDKITKRKLYEQAGVREYWIVDPDYHYVDVYVLNDKEILEPKEEYSEKDIAKCTVLPELTIDMSVVFPEV